MKEITSQVYWTPKTLALRAGVSVPTLHFYESKGLISAFRTGGNQRRYRRDMARRIAFIQAAQQVGITLKEVGEILSALPSRRTPTTDDWQAIATAWATLLDARIERLQRMRDKISSCIQCGCLSMEKCHIYNPDDRAWTPMHLNQLQ